MNKFEAVILISPEISNTQLQKELENFDNILNTNNGNIINKEEDLIMIHELFLNYYKNFLIMKNILLY